MLGSNAITAQQLVERDPKARYPFVLALLIELLNSIEMYSRSYGTGDGDDALLYRLFDDCTEVQKRLAAAKLASVDDEGVVYDRDEVLLKVLEKKETRRQ